MHAPPVVALGIPEEVDEVAARGRPVILSTRMTDTGTLQIFPWSQSPMPPGRSENRASSYMPGARLVIVIRALGSSCSATR